MTFRNRLYRAALAATIICAPLSPNLSAQSAADQSATVIVTLHPRPGAEDQLAQVLVNHWETARRLNLVLDTPHVTLKGAGSSGDTYFVEIFTWRDAGIPDNAPAAIQTIWGEMNKLVESRGGKRGIEIATVLHVK
jgi:hypothetical protein